MLFNFTSFSSKTVKLSVPNPAKINDFIIFVLWMQIADTKPPGGWVDSMLTPVDRLGRVGQKWTKCCRRLLGMAPKVLVRYTIFKSLINYFSHYCKMQYLNSGNTNSIHPQFFNKIAKKCIYSSRENETGMKLKSLI